MHANVHFFQLCSIYCPLHPWGMHTCSSPQSASPFTFRPDSQVRPEGGNQGPETGLHWPQDNAPCCREAYTSPVIRVGRGTLILSPSHLCKGLLQLPEQPRIQEVLCHFYPYTPDYTWEEQPGKSSQRSGPGHQEMYQCGKPSSSLGISPARGTRASPLPCSPGGGHMAGKLHPPLPVQMHASTLGKQGPAQLLTPRQSRCES